MHGLLITPFSKLKVTELHPTFGAEIEGVDFSHPIPDDVFEEILAASAKVGRSAPLLSKDSPRCSMGSSSSAPQA
jgi:hypothetical protein